MLLASCQSGTKNTENKNETMKINPEKIVENEYAEVFKVTLNPEEELAEHDGEVRLVYSLSDYSIEWVEKGESLGEKTWEKGNIHLHEKGKHSAKNTGTTKAEWIVFTRKNNALPKCEGFIDKDVNSLDGNFKQQIFDANLFRVTEIKLAPNDSIPLHEGINRIIYSLSDYTIYYGSSKEGNFEKSFKIGDAHWHTCDQHSIKNTGLSHHRTYGPRIRRFIKQWEIALG
jgi:hypothetical protein